MLPFLHDRLKSSNDLLAKANDTLLRYNRQDLGLAEALSGFLDEAVAVYRAQQRSELENRLLTLKARYITALRGVHPLRLEAVTGPRRAMQRTIALNVIQESSEEVRGEFLRDQQALLQGRADLEPIVLQGLALGLLEHAAGALPTQRQLEEFWQRALRAPETQSAARRVAMRLCTIDITLLFEELVATAGILWGDDVVPPGADSGFSRLPAATSQPISRTVRG